MLSKVTAATFLALPLLGGVSAQPLPGACRCDPADRLTRGDIEYIGFRLRQNTDCSGAGGSSAARRLSADANCDRGSLEANQVPRCDLSFLLEQPEEFQRDYYADIVARAGHVGQCAVENAQHGHGNLAIDCADFALDCSDPASCPHSQHFDCDGADAGVLHVSWDAARTLDRGYIPVVKDMSASPQDWSGYSGLQVTLKAHVETKATGTFSRRGWTTQATLAGSEGDTSPLTLDEVMTPGMEKYKGVAQFVKAQGAQREDIVQEFSPMFRWYLALDNGGETVWNAQLLDVTLSGMDALEPVAGRGHGSGGEHSYPELTYTFQFNFDDVVDPYFEYPDSWKLNSNNMDEEGGQILVSRNGGDVFENPDGLDVSVTSGYNKVSRRYRGPTSYPQVTGAACKNEAGEVQEGPTKKSECEAFDGYSWFPHAYTVPRDQVTKLKILPYVREGRHLFENEALELTFQDVVLLKDPLPKFVDKTSYA